MDRHNLSRLSVANRDEVIVNCTEVATLLANQNQPDLQPFYPETGQKTPTGDQQIFC